MPIGAYNPGIPLATDQPANSQGQLLGNFTAIDEIIDINHYKFNAGANAGKHKFVQLPLQAAFPMTSVTETALFTKAYQANGAGAITNELVLQFPNNGLKVPISNQGAGGLQQGAFTSGWCWLSSGLLMKWGRANINALQSAYTIVYPTGDNFAPPFNDPAYYIIANAISSIAFDVNVAFIIEAAGATNLAFKVNIFQRDNTGAAPVGPGAFQWLAIGPSVGVV